MDSLGCTDTATLRINPIVPDSNFTVNDRTICVGDEVSFTLSNENSMSSASWNFGGEGSSNDLNPSFTFNNSGDYTITVQLTDTNGCNTGRTRTEYVQVDDYPTAGFSKSVDGQDVICYPEQVMYTDTSIATFGVTTFASRTWDLGVSSPIVPSESVSWNYNAPGDYYISLVVTSTNGCRDTVIDTLTIVGPVADFSLSETTICVDDIITFDITDSSDVFAYLWGFGDGTGTDTTYTSNISSAEISHQYTEVPAGGSTKAQLVIWSKDFVCDYTVEKDINVHNVEANVGFEDSTVSYKKTPLGYRFWAWEPSKKMRLDESFRYLCLTPQNTLQSNLFEGFSVLDFGQTL